MKAHLKRNRLLGDTELVRSKVVQQNGETSVAARVVLLGRLERLYRLSPALQMFESGLPALR
jgi:hypothetical protein